MSHHWNDSEPIYLQLADEIKDMILNGDVTTGEALPSVRQLAIEYQVNPITVSKSYQLLVDDQLVDKKRGLGMFVAQDAALKLKHEQKKLFMTQQWPQIISKIEQLDIDTESLIIMLQKIGRK